MEHRTAVTADVTSGHSGEEGGQSFAENKCWSCIKKDQRIKQLELQLAELQDQRFLQAQNQTDYLSGEGSCGQNDGTGAMEGSSDMRKRNDSTQVEGLLRHDSGSAGCKEGELISIAGEMQNKPSTSSLVFNRMRAGPDPKGATGGCDDSIYGKSCQLEELKRLPDCHMQLDKLPCNQDHTVLVNLNDFSEGRLIAQKGGHGWDKSSVRMPFAEESTLIKPKGGFYPQDVKWPRWHVIHQELEQLAKASPLTTKQVETAIKEYNPKYKDEWPFDALHMFFEGISPLEREKHTHTLRRMAELAIQLPSKCPKNIPLLHHGRSHSITMSQGQIACLLANAFFCTFPHRNATHSHNEYANYPTINFHSLFGKRSERKLQKFKAIFHYFDVMTGEERKRPKGLVTFSRRYIEKREIPVWTGQQETLTKLYISSEGTIEKDGQGMLQVDFASSLVGGGVLAAGLVQEEILFLINPELIVARLFTEKLGDTECLKVTGSQQYSEYSGYSDGFTWSRAHEDKTLRDEWMRRHRQIVAIDAQNFKHTIEQFNMRNVTRELNKAYCGFLAEENTPPDYSPAVATGNWGCGAFGGDPRLKALIQMMAAAVAQRDMAYFTFRDSRLMQDIQMIHCLLTKHNVTVGRLYHMLENFCSALHSRQTRDFELYSFIKKFVEGTISKH